MAVVMMSQSLQPLGAEEQRKSLQTCCRTKKKKINRKEEGKRMKNLFAKHDYSNAVL
jgi:hypothetical protein